MTSSFRTTSLLLTCLERCKPQRALYGPLRCLTSTSTSPPVSATVANAAITATAWTNQKLSYWMQMYEDFLGLTEVKNAQNQVIQAERDFIEAQQERRERTMQVTGVQNKLKEIRAELDRTSRGEDKYLELVTQEHRLVKEERSLETVLEHSESRERDRFALLSAAVRESHEKERSRAERTKYWSVIGSVIGAIIGILGTSINNWLKMRELQSLVTRSAAGSAVPVENIAGELSALAKTQHQQLESFIGDLKTLLGEQGHAPEGQVTVPTVDGSLPSKDVLQLLTEQRFVLLKEMQTVKDLVAARKNLSPSSAEAIVYVKNDLAEALERTEQSMEWKMKINSIVTAAFLYTAFALSVPVIYYLFGQK
ncbi:mitochondrial potassium channel-like [Paramacrobiotus metropolitanus]|uniref:mitochondrial potassium channel-like n=1 Tax=Paramacrobiotus metropolitanus TaxID=2943436 RepID=UPI0024461C8D|nr:mitochondrial potassium channel-like [Paramacrobiotus metropolitanus]